MVFQDLLLLDISDFRIFDRALRMFEFHFHLYHQYVFLPHFHRKYSNKKMNGSGEYK